VSVLVIDDDDAVREAIGDVLESLGIQVHQAADGQSGITLYYKHQGDIQLVILDLTMKGWDGAQTLHELRKFDPGVQVIVSSGHSEGQIIDRLKNVHVAGFLRKPYDADALIDLIQLFLYS